MHVLGGQDISVVPVILGSIFHFILGWLWYGPLLGKVWMKSIGLDPASIDRSQQKGMAKAMIICFMSCVVIAMSTVHYVAVAQATSLCSALWMLICPILGFVLAPKAMSIEFEQRKWTYFLVSGGYAVVGILITGALAVLL